MKLRDDNMVYLDNDIKRYINDCLIGRGRIEDHLYLTKDELVEWFVEIDTMLRNDPEDQISASYDYDTLAECFIEYMDELKLILRDDENGL